MADALAAFLAAPLWAQIAMVIFACTFVVMVVTPRVTRRKYAAALAALAGSRWSAIQVDITPGRVPAWLGGPPHATGDAVFDGRFVLKQDGVPVRDCWLDAPTRTAVSAFFDQPAATGPVWVQEQRLQHLADATWCRLDLLALTARLRQQAALATALERTAGWRGPAA